MNYKKSNVPLYIKEVMKEKGIMSKTLQEALGMAQTSVSYIINNKANPSFEALVRIAEILDVPIGGYSTRRHQRNYNQSSHPFRNLRLSSAPIAASLSSWRLRQRRGNDIPLL